MLSVAFRTQRKGRAKRNMLVLDRPSGRVYILTPAANPRSSISQRETSNPSIKDSTARSLRCKRWGFKLEIGNERQGKYLFFPPVEWMTVDSIVNNFGSDATCRISRLKILRQYSHTHKIITMRTISDNSTITSARDAVVV